VDVKISFTTTKEKIGLRYLNANNNQPKSNTPATKGFSSTRAKPISIGRKIIAKQTNKFQRNSYQTRQ
jgi:hypothetical protein